MLRFHLVDVFATAPLTGNPLAVVENGDGLPLRVLHHIAREFNQSETTFVLPPTRAGADWRLRSFTAAGAEVFGAGHNALGAWWWLARSRKLTLAGRSTVLHQEIGDRVLPVTISRIGRRVDAIAMAQEAPVLGTRVDDVALLARALGLSSSELATDRVPCQVVFTGAPHLMVPIRDAAAVDRIQPDAAALLDVLRLAGAEGCYVFSLDPRRSEAIAYTRFFNPTVGIWEDPATGTAAGPLAAHLVANGLARAEHVLTIEQGTAIGRTSLIQVEMRGGIPIVSGRAVVVASGRLFLGPRLTPRGSGAPPLTAAVDPLAPCG